MPGSMPEDVLERAHLAQRPQLIAEVLEREPALADLLFELLRVALVDASSAFSMSDSTSPMPSRRETNRSAWNGSRSSMRSPLPTNAIGTPTTDTTESAAPPRASPSIFVSTTPVTPTCAVELAGALDRVLPGHRVGDVEQVDRSRRVLDRDELVHQLVVDVQAARGVDDDDVVADVAGLGQRALGARDRVHLAGRIVHAHAGLLAATPPAAESPPAAARRSRRAAGGGPAWPATSPACRWSSSCPSPAGRASGSRAAGPRCPAARPWRRRTAPAARRGRS